MPNPPSFPTIPVPTNEPDALLQTALALKQAVEMLTGQSIDQTHAAPHVFVQEEAPTARLEGDLWLCTAETYSFNVWNGEHWLKIGDIAPLAANASVSFNLKQFNKKVRT